MHEFLSGLLKGEGPVEFEVVRQTCTGNTVMNERLDRFNTASGREIELPVMGIFEVNEGLITFWRDYFDNGMFLRQIKVTAKIGLNKDEWSIKHIRSTGVDNEHYNRIP